MSIVDLSIKRPIMVAMGLIALFIFGVAAYFSLPLMLIPNIKMPVVTVQTVYVGASPEIVENQITKKIEDQISSLGGLDNVQSYSMDNVSIIIIQFDYSKDEKVALQEVKDKIDQISNDLPSDAEKPVATNMDISTSTPVMNIVLEGDMTEAALYSFATETVTDRLAQVSGVGSVDISGGAEREIQVKIDRATVYERNVPVTQILGIIKAANLDMPGGSFDYKGRDIPVQLKGTFENLDELRNLDVPTQKGVFKLHQLADVEDTSKTVRARTILLDKSADGGKGSRNDNAILLQIVKNPSGNTVDIVRDVQKILPQIEQENGGHIHFNVINEDATFVRDTVSDTLSNIFQGIVLTGLVLLFFLHDWRSTIIVAVAMPFSIVSTFLVMKMMGINFNLFSLTGISGATGTLVANSVVVLENVFRHKRNGLNREEATSIGTKEVVVAIFASTLTNVAVFIPLGGIQSIVGSLLSNFAYTTVISTIFSIVVSFTLTPLLCAKILPETASAVAVVDGKNVASKKPGRVSRLIELYLKKLERAYRRTLDFVLAKKKRCFIVVIGSFVLLLATCTQARFMGFELMPTTDGGKIQLNIELPMGTDLKRSAEVFKEIEDRLAAHEEVQKIETLLGSLGQTDQDVSLGQMIVYLVPKSEGRESSIVLAPRYRKELSDIPGAVINVSSVSEITIAGRSFGLDMYLKGEDGDILQNLADQIKVKLDNMEGLTNVTLLSKSGKQELDVKPNRMAISQDGLTVQEVAVTLRAAIDGLVQTKYKENNIEYDIRVMIDSGSIKDLEDIKNIPVVTKKGVFPISKYADISFENSTNKILRVNKTRTIEIKGDLLPGYSIGTIQMKATKLAKTVDMPPGYRIEAAGNSKVMMDTVKSLIKVFFVAILIIYMLLAATLEDLRQPLFILATVPLSIIGVVVIIRATGAVINIVAMLGIIMLVGIVVNNAILILDEYNQLRREKQIETRSALVQASGMKLKSILMSNIAIILGQMPMALGIGASGAEMRQPMGLVIVGGIISSTVMTLYVVPALEMLNGMKRSKPKKESRIKRIIAKIEKAVLRK